MKRRTQQKSAKPCGKRPAGTSLDTLRRIAKKQNTGKAKIRKPSKKVAPGSMEEFSTKSGQFQDKWSRVTHVIAKMRTGGISLRQASREYGIDPRAVVLLGHSALRKGSNGRFKAKASDRLLRVLVIPTPDGLREVAIRDSRQASLIAEYSNAVHKYLETGYDSALRKFRRQSITDAAGVSVPLITNLVELDRLGSAGVLSFESLYARSA
jgi:hypothetical protein